MNFNQIINYWFGQVLLDGEEVGKLLASDNQSLADHVVRSVAVVGERLVLRRAALLVAQAPAYLSALTHPASTSDALLGKYGALLVYTAKSKGDNTSQLTKQLCQHIIGESVYYLCLYLIIYIFLEESNTSSMQDQTIFDNLKKVHIFILIKSMYSA